MQRFFDHLNISDDPDHVAPRAYGQNLPLGARVHLDSMGALACPRGCGTFLRTSRTNNEIAKNLLQYGPTSGAILGDQRVAHIPLPAPAPQASLATMVPLWSTSRSRLKTTEPVDVHPEYLVAGGFADPPAPRPVVAVNDKATEDEEVGMEEIQ